MKTRFLILSLVYLASCSTVEKRVKRKVKRPLLPPQNLKVRTLSPREEAILRYRDMRLHPEKYDWNKKYQQFAKKRRVKTYEPKETIKIYRPKVVSDNVYKEIPKIKKQSSNMKVIREMSQRLTYYCFKSRSLKKHGSQKICTQYTENLKNSCLKKEDYETSQGRKFNVLNCVKRALY